MRHISARILFLIGVLASAKSAHCEEPTVEFPSHLILERFVVAKNGDDLLVPVTVAGKIRLFVVDTAATLTAFDTSLPLGQPVDVIVVTGPDEKVEIKLYQPPEAKLGRTSLGPLDAVVGMDLASIRQVTGLPIRGILGTDFLGRHVVHIDIEKGQLLLLKSVPNGASDELPISWQPGGLPYVTGEISPGEPVRFIVDTGGGGLNSGSLGALEIHSLKRRGHVTEIGKALKETISGTHSLLIYQAGTLKVGEYSVQSPIFDESRGPTPNVLGRGFWSRFAVTFDFPNRKLYLRKSASYDRLDRWNATGLHLWRRMDSIEVHSVDENSPAARTGLRKGDILIELDGLNADKTSCFDLFKTLCKGSQLECVIRRDSQELRLSIGQAR